MAGLANQFGCRAVVMGGGVVTAAMYMLTVFAPSVYVMLITYGFIGGIFQRVRATSLFLISKTL